MVIMEEQCEVWWTVIIVLYNNHSFLWLVRVRREKTPSELNMNALQSFCYKMLLHCYSFVLYVKSSIVEQIGKVKMKYS